MLLPGSLSRHAPALLRALANHRYERNDVGGVYFPGERAHVGGEYIITDRKTGIVFERCQNLLPTEGLTLILNILANHAAIPATISIALFANATTPIAAHVASGFTATYGEITSGSEGYTQAARVPWVTATAAAAVVNNYASPAVFTIITASTLSVYGVAMLTATAKGAVTGALISAAKFSAARVFSNTDEFDVKYQLGLTS